MPLPITNCLICRREMNQSGGIVREDARASSLLMLKAPYRVLQCRACKLRWLEPQPTEAENKQIYSPRYYELFKEIDKLQNHMTEKFLYRERERQYKMRLHEIEGYLRKAGMGKSILDIGAGPGDFVFIAQKMGLRAQGYEISIAAREKAKKKFKIDLLNGEIEMLPFKYEKLDVIHLNHVFEHLVQPLYYLDLFSSWLKPNGLLVMEVPYQFDSLLDMIKYWLHKPAVLHALHSMHHPYFYTPHSLKMVLVKHGFTLIRMRTYYPHMRLMHPGNTRRTFKRLFFFISGLLNRGYIIEIFARKIH